MQALAFYIYLFKLFLQLLFQNTFKNMNTIPHDTSSQK